MARVAAEKMAAPADARGSAERMLDAAERLFAEQGMTEVGLRAIAAAAKVNLASISYYFGSKEALVEEVFRRRATKIAAERDRGLDSALAEPDRDRRLEKILRVFLESGFAGDTPEDAARFAKLRARINTEDTALARRLLSESFDAGSRRFLAAIADTLPHLDESRDRLALPRDARRHGLHHGEFRPHPGADRRPCRPLQLSRRDRPAPAGRDRDLHERRAAGATLTFTLSHTQNAKEDFMADVDRNAVKAAAEKYKNWGKWGPNDEIGTLNFTTPEDIINAVKLVKKGKVISLALNFDHTGPQGAKSKYPAMGRTNPIHTMIRTGTDAYSGVLDKRGIRAADDMVTMPLQCGTQWDGLGHVFYENQMWNGYDCREVTSAGAQKCGIEKTKNKMVGRGVFLDVARYKGVECLEDGYGITNEDLYETAKKQKVELKRGDYVVVRTGQMERCHEGRHLGRLSGRRRAGLLLRDARLRPQDGARGARLRHLGLRSAAERVGEARHQPALALDHHPDHGHDHGRDLQPQGARRRLRGRRRLRISLRRPGHPDHRRGRLAGQPARDQVRRGVILHPP